jgi:hypothetical protein
MCGLYSVVADMSSFMNLVQPEMKNAALGAAFLTTYIQIAGCVYTSIFAALNAFVSINSLRGSTSSPISIVNTLSASIASSI